MEQEFGPKTAKAIRDSLGTPGNDETVDGCGRYSVCGIQAEDIITDVMERVAAAEGYFVADAWDVGNALKYLLRAGKKDNLDEELGKAENYLHHCRTGEWLAEGKDTRC